MKHINDHVENLINTCEIECPCGNICSHQQEVFVFSRKEDKNLKICKIDQYTGKVTKGIEKLQDQPPCPSSRRQGVLIKVKCETGDCPDFYVAVYQHKGTTYIETQDLKGNLISAMNPSVQ